MMEDSKRALSLIYDVATIAGMYLALVGLTHYIGSFEGFAAPFWALKTFKTSWPNWWIMSLGGCAIGGALVFGFNPFRGGGEYGSAKFAEEKDIKKFGLRDAQGVILGVLRGKYLRYSAPLSAIVVAPPGSGKTAGIAIPTLLSCGDSIIALDVKGELLAKTSDRRAEFSKIVRFAPGEENSLGWNPLAASELPERWDDRVIVVDRIASVLYAAGPKDDPHFLPSGKAVFMMFALYLLNRDGETSIPTIRSFALSKADPQVAIAEMADEACVPTRVKEEGYTMANKADREFSGIWGSFKLRLEVFADPRVAANFGRSDFSIQQLRRERTTVYLQVAPNDIERLKSCLAMFLESAALGLISKEPNPGEYAVRFINDEFPRLPAMDAMLNLPALSRSYGVSSIYIVQSFSQLVDTYGLEKAKTLKNICAYQVYFAQNEITVAEDVSRSIGPRTRKKVSFATSETKITRNTNETNEGVPLVMAQDVMGLKEREILVLVQNNFPTPIKGKDARWYLDGALRGLVPAKA